MVTETANLPVTIIRPSSGWVPLRLRELWEYRELLYFLTWRDIKVRYKQTVLGAAWAIIQPFFTMVVFSIFFGALAGIPSEGIPYPIFAYSALVPWMYFANALTQSSNSLVEYEGVITKVYFPRLLVPMAAVLAGLMDFAIAFIVLIGMMLFYGIVPTAAIWTVPLFILLATATAGGGGPLVVGVKCSVPRRAVCYFLSDSVLALCHAYCLPQQPRTRAVANDLRPEPDGRRRGGLPLGFVGHRASSRPAHCRFSANGCCAADKRALLFSSNGRHFC